jgi:histidinol-phosphate aminotransferase
MLRWMLSRRQFGRLVSTTVGAAMLAPKFTRSVAEARLPPGVPEDVIQLNANENPYGPSAKALEAMTKSQRWASRYPGHLEQQVLETIAQHHGTETACVLLGCGSGEILRIADMAFLAAGKNLVVAEPTFEAVLTYARVTRAEPVKVPLTADFRHDLPRMAAVCNAHTGLVYVCNPNNPTGTIVTREELAAFFDRVPPSVAVLVDEAYYHFVEDSRCASACEWLNKLPNVIVVRTFSKVYGMAGMRLGYAVGSKDVIGKMREQVLGNNSNAAVLEAALVSLRDGDLVPRQRKLNNDTRRWLCNELEKNGYRAIPSEGNFVMIQLHGEVQPVVDAFRQRRILVGRQFPSMKNWLRVSIGKPAEMEAFLVGLRTIAPVTATMASSARS